MKRSLLAAVMALFAASPAIAWDKDAMNVTIDQTNFLVNAGCSGTLVDTKNQYILTNNHCVADQYETVEREKIDDEGVVKKEKVRRMKPGTVSQFTFTGPGATVTASYRVSVKAVDAKRDLALLQVTGALPNKIAATIACKAPDRGDKVYVVGNPMGVLYSSVTVGVVSSVQRTYESIGFDDGSANRDNALMQVSAGVVGGNSGGAAYNDQGHMIGVPVLTNRANEVLGFAVPHSEVVGFLTENKVEFTRTAGCAQ